MCLQDDLRITCFFFESNICAQSVAQKSSLPRKYTHTVRMSVLGRFFSNESVRTLLSVLPVVLIFNSFSSMLVTASMLNHSLRLTLALFFFYASTKWIVVLCKHVLEKEETLYQVERQNSYLCSLYHVHVAQKKNNKSIIHAQCKHGIERLSPTPPTRSAERIPLVWFPNTLIFQSGMPDDPTLHTRREC